MDLVGNKKNFELLSQAVKEGRLSHAYLFVGPKSIGKSTFARYFGKSLLCQAEKKPCGQCPACHLFDAGNHPDFLVNDSDEAVGVGEIRELIRFLEMKPYQSPLKIALIAHFERLSVSAANSFLKTLEEPAANTILIITAEQIQNLLPTVVSRSQIIRFREVSENETLEYLDTTQGDKELVRQAVEISGGRVGLAVKLLVEAKELAEIRDVNSRFEQIIKEGSLVDRLQFAEELARDKEYLPARLDYLEIYMSRLLKEKEPLKNCLILDKIAKSKDFLSRNANPRLTMESLMLTGA